MISDSVGLCDTEDWFLQEQLVGANVRLPRMQSQNACAFDDLSHVRDMRKMCVCVTLCAYDEVFCLHTPSRARHSTFAHVCTRAKKNYESSTIIAQEKSFEKSL